MDRRLLTLVRTALLVLGLPPIMGLVGACGVTPVEDPKLVTRMTFSLDFARARTEGVLTAAETDARVLDYTIKVVAARLERWGAQGSQVVAKGPAGFDVLLPAGTNLEVVPRLASPLGDTQFRIEVLSTYPFWEKGTRPREVVWDESLGAFDEYKKGEMDRWSAARDGGVAYRPSDPRFRLVPRVDWDSLFPEDFAIVEEPKEARLRFGGRMISLPRVTRSGSGALAVRFDVKQELQESFGEWTAANVGLPMAIVLDGKLMGAPLIQGPLSSSVEFTLDSQRRGAAQEAKRLAILIGTGTLRVKPVLVLVEPIAPEAPPEKAPPMGK